MPWIGLLRRADVVGLFLILTLTLVGTEGFLRNENVFGWDAVAFYYPWYSLLGEGLGSGDIPGWNPHQFSGTPFAADIQSGWAYLPAMLLFTLLPLVTAAEGFVLFHLLLAGLSTYALARALKMGVPGALLAAVAYEFCGLLYLQTGCCFLYVTVMPWLPLAFLGAEKAFHSTRWLERASWWGISGLALSQIAAAWLGQGSYYAMVALGGYIAYRTLLSPSSSISGIRGRLMSCLLHSAGVLAFGFGLAAAGVLPRLEYNAFSNLAGGYPMYQAEGLYGWAVKDWGTLLEAGSNWYMGVTVLVFAVVAPLIARRRFAVPYFAILAPCALVLSGQGPTPLHSILYQVLPYFERLHPHRPERVMVVFYLAAALLAGAELTELGRRATKKPQLLVPPAVVAAWLAATRTEGWQTNLSFLTTENGSPSLIGPLLALASVTTLVLGLVPLSTRFANQRGLALTSVALLAFVDLFGTGRAVMAELPDWKALGTNELATNYDATGAAEFLRSREGAFRYASYAAEEWSLLHNSAMMLGLEQVQGYNPLRLASYDEYVSTMNRSEQNYHWASPYADAFSSPLFDLLNARYVVIPADTDQEWLQRALNSQEPPVYEDTRLKVIENPEALPRAWIVHSTRQVRSGQEALDLLSAGQVDPRETALLAEDPPEQMSQPDDPSAEWASITEHSADSIQLQTVTETPGLLVLSEVYYPAWKAYVDGHPVPVYPTNQLLRSVPIPAGEHTVELRYESWALRVGLAISLVAFAVLAVLVISAATYRKSAGGKGTAPVRGGLR